MRAFVHCQHLYIYIYLSRNMSQIRNACQHDIRMKRTVEKLFFFNLIN